MAYTFGGRRLGGGSTAFNINPPSRGGQGAFGAVPGPVGMPANRFAQFSDAFPNLGPAIPQITSNLISALQGDIDWDEIQDEAARFGVQSGMPGSQFSGIRGLRLGEEAVNRRRRQGLQDYLTTAQGISSLLDDPNLAASLATQNAVWESAPDPQMAADEQMRRWQEQFDKISGAGTGRLYSGVWGPGGGVSTAGFGLGGGSGGPRDALGFDLPSGEDFRSYPALPGVGMPEGSVSGFANAFDPRAWVPGGSRGGIELDDPFAEWFEGYNYLQDDPNMVPDFARNLPVGAG